LIAKATASPAYLCIPYPTAMDEFDLDKLLLEDFKLILSVIAAKITASKQSCICTMQC